MTLATRIEPGLTRINLADYDPGSTSGLGKEKAEEMLDSLTDELDRLQDLLYAARMQSVLIVLQGMDTSGKDGTIRKVMAKMDPLGCRVESFKAPTEEELAHDFLWRAHRVVPRLGMVTVFNRSHYEDVVVVRVRKLVPDNVWRARYEQINWFERLLAETGTIIMKFFLHVSSDQQKERLEAREKDFRKAWKLSVDDWKERSLWDDYQCAYEEAIGRCSTDYAPWYIVPANNKWFRNVAVADTMVRTLRSYEEQWETLLREMAAKRLSELRNEPRSHQKSH